MRTVAVLPVKRFGAAKQRLGDELSPGARRALAEAMVTDVLIALRRARTVDAVVVVTGESSATALALGHGADAIPDPDDAGHVEAAERGVRWALSGGADRVLLVPGDTPALDPKELDALLAPHPFHPLEPEVVIVPDRHGTGTNGLLLTPPDVIAPAFGPGSCARHRSLAIGSGASCRLEHPPSLLLDIDTGDDLAALLQQLGTRGGAQGDAASGAPAAHTRALLARVGGLQAVASIGG
jgi:2-phospho-L-lactate/phosphoenolpyruvate guanylyltransferase